MVVSHPTLVMGIKLRSSARAVHTLIIYSNNLAPDKADREEYYISIMFFYLEDFAVILRVIITLSSK